jgi:hypothetical protein
MHALYSRRRWFFHAYVRRAVLLTALYPDACAVLSTALYFHAYVRRAVLTTALLPDACAVLSTALYLLCLRSTCCTLDGASSRCMRCTLDVAGSFMLTFDALYSRWRCIFHACAYFRCAILSSALHVDAFSRCAVLSTALYLSCAVLSTALYLSCLLSMRCTLDGAFFRMHALYSRLRFTRMHALYSRRRCFFHAYVRRAVLSTALLPDACVVLSTALYLLCLRSTRCALNGASSRCLRCTLDSAVSFMLKFDALYSRRRFFQMHALYSRQRCIFCAYVRRAVLSTALLPDACAVLSTALYLLCMRILSMRCTPDDFRCAVLSSAPHVDAFS